MKKVALIVFSLVSFCEGQSVIVDEQFARYPDRRMTPENKDQFPQSKSWKALSKFLTETADKRTLTKWFGEPTILSQRIDDSRTPLPKNYVTTHFLQDPLRTDNFSGLCRWVVESYCFTIEGTDLGILYRRSAHSDPSKNEPFKASSQWWGGGYFLARWPKEKLGPYKDFPTAQLNEWENQKTTEVLKILWKKLAEDYKE